MDVPGILTNKIVNFQILFLLIQFMRRFWIYEEYLYCRNMSSWKVEFAVHQFWWLNLERVSVLRQKLNWGRRQKSFNKKTFLHRSRRWISHPFSHRAADINFSLCKLENDFLHKLSFCAKDLIGFSHLIFQSPVHKYICEMYDSDLLWKS